MPRVILCAVVMFAITGCVTIADVNHAARKIETAWMLDYQRIEWSHRTRIVDAPSDETFLNVKKTLVDMGLPVINSNMVSGVIKARGFAPAPLTQEEWDDVVEIEGPRVTKLSGGLLYLSSDPSDYELTLEVLVRGASSRSIVAVDYTLSSPRYETMGFRMPKVAPPQAAVIGVEKFWTALTNRLSKASKPTKLRKLEEEEEI